MHPQPLVGIAPHDIFNHFCELSRIGDDVGVIVARADEWHGRLESHGWNYLYGHHYTVVTVNDEYAVFGAPGPPLTFEVVLQLKATITPLKIAAVHSPSSRR